MHVASLVSEPTIEQVTTTILEVLKGASAASTSNDKLTLQRHVIAITLSPVAVEKTQNYDARLELLESLFLLRTNTPTTTLSNSAALTLDSDEISIVSSSGVANKDKGNEVLLAPLALAARIAWRASKASQFRPDLPRVLRIIELQQQQQLHQREPHAKPLRYDWLVGWKERCPLF